MVAYLCRCLLIAAAAPGVMAAAVAAAAVGGGGGADVGCQTSAAVKLLRQPFKFLTLGQGLTLRVPVGTRSRPYIWNKV